MHIPPRWQFRSITYRLIGACVLAALVIYGSSFFMMRRVVQGILVGATTQIAQSQVDAVAIKSAAVFASVEQQAAFILAAHSDTPDANKPLILALQRTLSARLTGVHAIAFIPEGNGQTSQDGIGYQLDASGVSQAMGASQLRALSNTCINTSATQAAWRPEPSGGTAAMVYCAPWHDPAGRQSVLVVRMDMDWLVKLVQSDLRVKDAVSQITLGQAFARVLPLRAWLVAPLDPAQTLARIAQADQAADARPDSARSDNLDTLTSARLAQGNVLIGISIPSTDLSQLDRHYLLLVIASMGKDMLLILLAVALVSRQTTRGLRALTATTEDIARGNLDTTLPVINRRDEVGRLSRAFRRMRDALNVHIRELQVATAAKQKLESELAIASLIQRSMVPVIDVTIGAQRGYDVSAILQPARSVGGDFYDYFAMGVERLCIVIGDVADKGIPAALLMARTIALLRALAPQKETPAEILAAVNRELCINNDECMFVTLFCAVLQLRSGVLSYGSAGHDAPLLVRGREVRLLAQETAAPVGLDPDTIYPQQECTLLPDDLLVLYTDGITEALDPQGELFSEANLLDAIAAHPHANPARAIRTIQYFHRRFVGSAPQSDDITLLALCYQPLSPYVREVNVVDWSIAINSELAKLDEVKQRIGTLLRSWRLPVECIEDCQLIVEEILVNIVQYGEVDQSLHSVNLRLKFDHNELEMTFEDDCKPFNPLIEAASPRLDADDEAREQGGFGFHLVRELSTDIAYARRDGKNILTIRQAVVRRPTNP